MIRRHWQNTWMAAPLCLLAAALLCGCWTTHYTREADEEVYAIIDRMKAEVPGMASSFSIDQQEITLEDLPTLPEDAALEFLGEAGKNQIGSSIISLEKALDIAVKNSRDYQSRKESLYISALQFTETRQEYRPVLSGGRVNAQYDFQINEVNGGSQKLAKALNDLTGTPADLLQSYATVVESAAKASGANTGLAKERSISGNTSFDVGMLTRGGTAIALALSSNFFRFVTGDGGASASSALVGSLAKPLLGSNRRVARETILQAERDVLYSLRSFTRFRKTFSIGIASTYYNILQSKDTVRNNYQGYQDFLRAFERSQAEAEYGRIKKSELGRAEEEVLQSQNDWIISVQRYNDNLDAFKIQLGLTTDARVVLDDAELERLMERGLMPPPTFTLEEAIEVAFSARLDYYNQLDQVDDIGRKLEIAGEGLLPDLDLNVNAIVPSQSGNRFEELDFKRYSWDLSLALDPKLNRKPVRNRYRSASIRYDKAKRDLQEFKDNMKLEVRSSWRALEQAKFSYGIQQNSLKLSDDRILELKIRSEELGEASAIDQVDAANALIDARNRVSSALVDHTISNLELWLDMGILYIKEDGQWEDVENVQETNG